ncbi:MAG TPA: hypothetical protein VGK25_12945 [Ignavibacteria bacterium]
MEFKKYKKVLSYDLIGIQQEGILINSKAIKVLKLLTNDEFKQFGKFINSPFFNSNKSLNKLYLFLKKHYPLFEFTAEDAFKFLFPGKKFYIAKIRQLFAEIYKLWEDFLAYNSLSADSFAKKYYIIKELDKHKLDNLFLTNVKKLEEELNNSKIGDDLYRKRVELENAIIDFHLMRNNRHKIQYNILGRGEYYMNSIMNWLHLQNSDVLANELDYGKINEPNIAAAFISNINLVSFSGWLNENMCPQFTYTAIFCNLLLMHLHFENESYYFKSKNLILDNFDLFDNNMKKALILTLRNYCNIKCHILFKKEKFELDKIMYQFAKTNFFDFGIFFAPIFYLNTIRNALALGEIQWTEKFINDFTKYIHDDERENNQNLALAFLAFKKSEFEESLKYLNQIKLTTPTIKPFFKMLILQVYYELDMIEPGLSAIDSMHHFINNTKELGNRIKQMFQSQLNIINEFYKLKIQNEKIDDIEISKLKDDIEKAPFPIKSWFYEKVKELESKVASKNQGTYSRTLSPSKISVN